MRTLWRLVLISCALLLAAFGAYVEGRILLPELGLTAPGYGTWVASTVITVGAIVAVRLITSLIDEEDE